MFIEIFYSLIFGFKDLFKSIFHFIKRLMIYRMIGVDIDEK